jgi:phosphoribosylaminoimidazolecarboxamide formyltransferase/IMP cyclohydrolase
MGRKANPVKRALISVWDKTGIVDFARALVDEFGIEILSTGGTARTLQDAGIPVTLVEEITGFAEMLDGRVKSLHPKIHAAILADRDNPEHMRQLEEQGIKPIDMVVVNLYPFKETVANPNCTFEQAIEMIDIGGPCLLRAAAKNHRHVIPVCQLRSYDVVLENLREKGDLEVTMRTVLASVAFEMTKNYDMAVEDYLTTRWTEMRCGPCPEFAVTERDLIFPIAVVQRWAKFVDCRYGENPHQGGALYAAFDSDTRFEWGAKPQGSISFNNYLDAAAAFELCRDISTNWGRATALWNQLSSRSNTVDSHDRPESRSHSDQTPDHVALFIKHTNACGVGISNDTIEAYRRAYVGDPNAAMGGILAVSFPVEPNFAETVMDSLARWGKAAGAGAFFVEVWLAPKFDGQAVQIIRTLKPWGVNVRLLTLDMAEPDDPAAMDYRRIPGGFLVQTKDLLALNQDQWKVVTKRSPAPSEMADLRLAWLVAKHTRSNAISICKDGMLIGNGAGQMSRVMSCRIATWLAAENGHGEKLRGAVAASDAFFPFADGPKILIDSGITALIQPGGSKRDAETTAFCDDHNVAMIHTGTRHFRH